MKEKILEKLEFIKKKKDEYVGQVVAMNGAIQVLEELLQELSQELSQELLSENKEVKEEEK